MIWQSLLAIAALALVHVVAGLPRLAFFRAMKWYSFASGVAVAYVFFHVMPVLGRMSAILNDHNNTWLAGEWIAALALAGACTFHLIILVTQKGDVEELPPLIRCYELGFWLPIAAFALYNLLAGYTLVAHPYDGLLDTLAYQVALMLHFLIIDMELRQHHAARYDRQGRWIMAGAVLIGGALGHGGIGNPFLTGGTFAFLAGGMIVNVLKEELSGVGRAALLPFLGGAALLAATMLAARTLMVS